MLTEQRKQLLLARLKKEGKIIAKEMSHELALSEDTIRRDLRELAAQGHLTRVHGGAMPASPTVVNISARRLMASEEKARLGRAAIQLLAPAQTTFVDGGTTNLEIIRNLSLEYKGTIVTHSPTIAAALEFHDGVDVRLIGGSLYRHSMVAVGAAALEAILNQTFDMCFIGGTGFDIRLGLTTGDYEESLIKRAIIKRSAEVCSLMTGEKIGAASQHIIAPAGALTMLIVAKETKLNIKALPQVDVIRA